MYVDARNSVCYMFRTDDLRMYLKKHRGEYKEKLSYDRWKDKYSNGAIVPIRELKKYVSVREIDFKKELELHYDEIQ